MSESTKKINVSEKFQQITDKRLALESLIKIAQGVHSQQVALNELAMAAKPSQEFPKKVISFFSAMYARMKDTPVKELMAKLESFESVTQQTLDQIFKLVDLDINQLRDDELDQFDSSDFGEMVKEFKNRTQTCLALRFVLKERGVVVAPFKLPVSQEAIFEQVEKLKQKESACVGQIRSEIDRIIKDTAAILLMPNLPETMVKDLTEVKQGMMVNLAHLDSGGAVNDIPNVFEVVTLETQTYAGAQSAHSEDANAAANANASADGNVDDNSAPEPDPDSDPNRKKTKSISQSKSASKDKPKSFWWKLNVWLTSPWSTRWSSIGKTDADFESKSGEKTVDKK